MKVIGENEVRIQLQASTGPQGPAGPAGPQGPQGPQGETGPRGPSGPTGPKGDKGDTGERGPAGAVGPTGATGPQGIQGERGDAFTYDDFTQEQLEALRGPQGPAGPQGDVGPQGQAGPQGEKGEKGDAGPQGPEGPAGSIENLPIASATQLGGVQPVAKTEEMTQPVGVDALGALFTAPGGGSGNEIEWKFIREVTIPDDASTDESGVTFFEKTGAGTTDYQFAFNTDKDGNPFSYNELFVYGSCGTSHTSKPNNIRAALKYPYTGPDNVTVEWFLPNLQINGGKLTFWWHFMVISASAVQTYGRQNGGALVTPASLSSGASLDNGKITGFKSLFYAMNDYGFCPGSTFTFYGR